MSQTEERSRLTQFNKIMTRFLWGDPSIPEAVRNSALNIDWDSTPIVYLRMAANDMVEAMQDIADVAAIEELDALLTKHGAATLSQLRDKGYRRTLQILSWKRVTKEDDVYLLKSILDNDDDARFSTEDREKAEHLIEGYASDV